ncbi:MBL fold metallo-hydrolase [Candidatus Pacearchaeota archaeon]|nr:MBL fold metallo-hydrolase [Candidatus Pacearchaeota archaeon]
MINKIKENIYQLSFKEFGSCVYIIKIDSKTIMIDTSSQFVKPELVKDLKQIGLEPEDIEIVILTHAHWDHDANTNLFNKADVYNLKNIDNLPITEFKIYKVPGHTKDSLAILYKDVLFSGDTIFHNEGIGRYDFPESVPEKIHESVEKLRNLNYKILCPGHID